MTQTLHTQARLLAGAMRAARKDATLDERFALIDAEEHLSRAFASLPRSISSPHVDAPKPAEGYRRGTVTLVLASAAVAIAGIWFVVYLIGRMVAGC